MLESWLRAVEILFEAIDGIILEVRGGYSWIFMYRNRFGIFARLGSAGSILWLGLARTVGDIVSISYHHVGRYEYCEERKVWLEIYLSDDPLVAQAEDW